MMTAIAEPSQRYTPQCIDQAFYSPMPMTSPWFSGKFGTFSTWPEPETVPEEEYLDIPADFWDVVTPPSYETIQESEPKHVDQEVLLLHAAKQRYMHARFPIPQLENEREMLVEVQVIGLNPIDWKAPDFGFGLPNLPCISGRDMAGKIVRASRADSRFRIGDTVIGISTDYRDSRKSAFQQFAVVTDYNACKIPSHLSALQAAPLGVAYVAASLALGVCMGMDFVTTDGSTRGPDLLQILHSIPRDAIPRDVRTECFDGIKKDERVKSKDWIVIWGGSSATGCCAVQLAKLAGLKVISVIDVARSGDRMLQYGADLLVDRLDTERAISIIKGVTKGKLRFALDTQGRESSTLLAKLLQGQDRSHLVGLVALPKETTVGVKYHSVPIKLFHESPLIGENMTLWLEDLLNRNLISTPKIEIAGGGLIGINMALDRLRSGEVNGPRIVVPLTSITGTG